VPFLREDIRKRYGGTTAFSLNYGYQHRPRQFDRHIANASMRYNWQSRTSKFTFSLFDLSYIYLPLEKIDDAYYEQNIKGKFIEYSFQNHFTLKMGFSYSTTNQRNNIKHQSFYTFRSNISAAGNILYGLSKLTKQKPKDNQYQIFNTPYSQFVKGEMDFSYNQFISEKIRFVFHTTLGIGLPYGNSQMLPFEERFISNLRGWHARTLGPGGYNDTTTTKIKYLEKVGDIKFEMNAEFRFKLFWILEGAAFIDAGNIWTIKNYPDQKGGLFSFKNGQFLEQIGCNYGVGIRADFSFFIIRIDLGIKLYDPKYPDKNNRWRGVSSSDAISWNNDCNISFGIGYPF
jgi:outer membrane protein assembly factor BamA